MSQKNGVRGRKKSPIHHKHARLTRQRFEQNPKWWKKNSGQYQAKTLKTELFATMLHKNVKK